MFIDVAKIKIKAGNGGNGAVSFHRDKFTTHGGPDGGNGGNGGNIIFQADNNLSTLSHFRYQKDYIAKNGNNGMSAKRSGKRGEDLIIKVPKGTIITDNKYGNILADISDYTPKILAKGGKGGLGNMNFANSVRQSPKFAKAGEFGQELEVKLELKLLADVGLIGYPNVGKSTFLSIVSNAKPQIANYHFTTLSPILGMVDYDDNLSFIIADIPGLIEGASNGVGLGHDFLRHVERCRMLIHMVDISGIEGRSPIDDFNVINEELYKFNKKLSEKPMIVVGSKSDISNEQKIDEFKNYVEDKGYKFFNISSSDKSSIQNLLNNIAINLSKMPPVTVFQPTNVYIHENQDDELKFEYKNGVYSISAQWLEKLINSVNFDDYDSMKYFQNVLSKSGINDMLREKGVKQGDIVKVCEVEFEFVE